MLNATSTGDHRVFLKKNNIREIIVRYQFFNTLFIYFLDWTPYINQRLQDIILRFLMKKGLHNTNKNKGTETLFMFKTIIHDTCTTNSLGVTL